MSQNPNLRPVDTTKINITRTVFSTMTFCIVSEKIPLRVFTATFAILLLFTEWFRRTDPPKRRLVDFLLVLPRGSNAPIPIASAKNTLPNAPEPSSRAAKNLQTIFNLQNVDYIVNFVLVQLAFKYKRDCPNSTNGVRNK